MMRSRPLRTYPSSTSALAIRLRKNTSGDHPLFVVWFQGCEISPCVRTKENPGNQCEDDRVGDDLTNYRKTDGHVKGHPDEREPARPVPATEHEASCNKSQQ